jgi:8-amino-7-oxononanoate synthase
LPPAIAAAGIASLKIIKENPDLHLRLLKKAAKFRNEVTLLGYSTTNYNTPIIPLIMNSPEEANGLSAFLQGKGIIVPFINYPVNNRISMLRVTISAVHTEGQTDQLLEMLKLWKKSGSQK